jgi:hypothetical protein
MRRKFSSASKAKVAIEAIKEHRTISELAQEFEILNLAISPELS